MEKVYNGSCLEGGIFSGKCVYLEKGKSYITKDSEEGYLSVEGIEDYSFPQEWFSEIKSDTYFGATLFAPEIGKKLKAYVLELSSQKEGKKPKAILKKKLLPEVVRFHEDGENTVIVETVGRKTYILAITSDSRQMLVAASVRDYQEKNGYLVRWSFGKEWVKARLSHKQIPEISETKRVGEMTYGLVDKEGGVSFIVVL